MARPARRLGELAEALGLPLEGDPQIEITGAGGLDDAGAGELSFVSGPSYAKSFAASGAAAFIAPVDFASGARVVLRSPAPYADFARALDILYPREAPRPGVHPTAVVGDDAKLGDDVWIGAYVVIGARAVIGARSRIHPHVTVYADAEMGEDCELHAGACLREGVRLGDRVCIQNGAVVGADGFGFVYAADGRRFRVPHRAGVRVGDEVEIGANSTIDASHAAQQRSGRDTPATWIGSGVKIDNLVQVGHGVGVGDGSTLCSQVGLAGGTEIGRFVTFAGKAASGGHLSVGDGAVIGAKCGLTGDVAPGAQLHGFPPLERRTFARVAAAWKRLPDLLKRVKRIEKKLGMEAD